MKEEAAKVIIIGASGYTGIELIRLLSRHPYFKITALFADKSSGQDIADIYPHVGKPGEYPQIRSFNDDLADEINSQADLVFFATPYGVAQKVAPTLSEKIKIVDLSSDFRLSNPQEYEKWYGLEHKAVGLQKEAVFGIPELYRNQIKSARLVANSGCYVVSALIPLVPLLKAETISSSGIVIDSKSGASGAGRNFNTEKLLFCEVTEGIHAYGMSGHRHCGELDQELTAASSGKYNLTGNNKLDYRFVPHLLPQSRGILSTIYVKGKSEEIHNCLSHAYVDEIFVKLMSYKELPKTSHVRGSNTISIGVAPDRNPEYSVVVSCIDNLVKGASGQALQNANIMFGFKEDEGLEQLPLFP